MGLNVLIVGGGVGGLCLAQGLRKAGIGVTVFERDTTRHARGQGYRFRVDAEGDAALKECLAPNLYELYRATANCPSSPPMGAFDPQMNLIYRLPAGGTGGSGSHLAVNRMTLREVLMTDLEDILRFDHTLIGFEQNDHLVRARFANGQEAEGDLLVAADGVHSLVRRSLLPDAEIQEADAWCIYGRTLLNTEILSQLPESLFNGFTPILGPNRQTLALGMYRPNRPFDEAVAELAPNAQLTPVPDYLMWIFVAPKGEGSAPHSDTPSDLHRFVLEQTMGWHPDLRHLLEQAEIVSTFPVVIRSSRQVPAWPSSHVTFLGDAIHTMTPAGGTGANTAFRDAALLTRELATTLTDDSCLVAAVARYEAAMRDYGFAAVERSLAAATQLYRIQLSSTEAKQ